MLPVRAPAENDGYVPLARFPIGTVDVDEDAGTIAQAHADIALDVHPALMQLNVVRRRRDLLADHERRMNAFAHDELKAGVPRLRRHVHPFFAHRSGRPCRAMSPNAGTGPCRKWNAPRSPYSDRGA